MSKNSEAYILECLARLQRRQTPSLLAAFEESAQEKSGSQRVLLPGPANRRDQPLNVDDHFANSVPTDQPIVSLTRLSESILLLIQ